MESFFQAPNEIFDTDLTIYQKMVLAYLYRAGNNGRPIFPSYATIAIKCGMSRAKAVNTIKELERLGILSVIRRRKDEYANTNLYHINRQAICAHTAAGDIYHDNGLADCPGKQGVSPGTQDIPPGTQDIPTGTQDIPGVVYGVYPINNQSINNQYKETDINNIDSSAAASLAVTLPLKDGTEYHVSQEKINECKSLFPAVTDVMQEFRKMRAWLINNPARRKTKSGVLRFVNYWLSKEQGKGQANIVPAARPPDNKISEVV